MNTVQPITTEEAEDTAPATGNKTKPVKKIRIGSTHAAIWRNGNFYSVSFERRYQDKDQKWQSADSWGARDLLELSKAADRAHDAILELLKDAQ